MMIYPEQRGDYLFKSWNTAEFDVQFDILMDEEAFIAVAEEGFVRLSLLEKLGQMIKSFFGGTDYSQRERVQSAWLKFLYYGEAQGFLKEDYMERLRHRITDSPPQYFDPAISKVFKEIRDFHQYSTESKSNHLNNLRKIVTDYHRRHASSLRPGFWRRILTSPLFDIKNLVFFGDAPLQLSQRALEQQPPNPRSSLAYLQKAFDLKNNDPEFQEKLAEQLQELSEDYSLQLEGKQRQIQELWIQLGQTAFENELTDLAQDYLSKALETDSKHMKARLQIGKLYLDYEEYDLAQPFLSDLQKSLPHDLKVQIAVGRAYWQMDKFKEAMDVYEAVISYYEKSAAKLVIDQDPIASVYNHMGIVHLKKHVSNGNLPQAISFFSEAVKIDSTVLEYQENLWKAYDQQWQASKANFAADHGHEWLKFLNIIETSIVKKNSKHILSMLLTCSEQYFQVHQNQKAHACLEKALTLFRDDVDIKIQVLDLAIRYADWDPLKSKLETWEKEHYANPYLLEKIGDAYWNSQTSQALKAYQEGLELFDQRIPLCSTDAERKTCQQHMADIQARIGIFHLQVKPGLFKGNSYDEAIKNLEKAASLNSDLYSSELFDAYIAAVQAEKQRTILFRDTNKIMNYLQKAFQVSHQKGYYLIELMQLYLDNKCYDEAIALYYAIQDQSWAEKWSMPAAIYSELARQLQERSDSEMALTCLEQAYQLDPKNQKYKLDFYQSSLLLAQEAFSQIQEKEEKDSIIDDLLEIAQPLETCWKDGFDNVEKLKPLFQEVLVKIYVSLANVHIQRCLLPQPAKEMDKKEVKQHKEQHKDDIKQALNYFDKALSYQPENAALHFEKGLLLDWIIDFEQAIKELELAVKYQPRNPFYHKILGPLYFAVYSDSAKNEDHQALAEEYASPEFIGDYKIWEEEFMCQVQTRQIDPHAYTKKKGWFS